MLNRIQIENDWDPTNNDGNTEEDITSIDFDTIGYKEMKMDSIR